MSHLHYSVVEHCACVCVCLGAVQIVVVVCVGALSVHAGLQLMGGLQAVMS